MQRLFNFLKKMNKQKKLLHNFKNILKRVGKICPLFLFAKTLFLCENFGYRENYEWESQKL